MSEGFAFANQEKRDAFHPERQGYFEGNVNKLMAADDQDIQRFLCPASRHS